MSNSLNPLLAKVKLPGRVFQLPSKGIFYEPGILAEHVRNAEIQVKPMSALTELKIKSADLLYSTKIIREVCLECAPEILKPELLTSRDVDALFTFLVVSTYGSTKTIKAIHNCEKASWNSYAIDMEAIVSNPRNACLDQRELLFQVALPNEQIVHLKPVNYMESIELMTVRQAISRKEGDGEPVTNAEYEKMVIGDVMAVIEAVETGTGGDKIRVTDRKMIEEWLRTLSTKFIETISLAASASAEWGFDFRVQLKCKDCGEHFMYDLELNPINFFSG